MSVNRCWISEEQHLLELWLRFLFVVQQNVAIEPLNVSFLCTMRAAFAVSFLSGLSLEGSLEVLARQRDTPKESVDRYLTSSLESDM